MTFWKVMCLVLLAFDAVLTAMVVKRKAQFNANNVILIVADCGMIVVLTLYVLGIIK